MPEGSRMKIALAQYSLSAKASTNLAKALDWMRAARQQDADLVLFPELCLSPFFPQFPRRDVSHYLINPDHGDVLQFQRACRELRVAASPNVYLQEGARCFDASLMIGEDGVIKGISKMVHIAQVPGFYEQDYYEPSDTGFKVFDTPRGRVGIVVCFDRHYPESIRTCVLRGASLILIPTANTMDEPRDLFVCELRAAAFQNGVYIAMCNRVGVEGQAEFCGESIVVDPHGAVVAGAGTQETLLLADIDLAEVEVARGQRPYLLLRNPEMYERGEKEPRGFV